MASVALMAPEKKVRRTTRQRDELRDLITTLEDKGEWCDIERLKKRKPHLYNGIQGMLHNGFPVIQICTLLRVKPLIVRKVRDDPTCQSELSQWKDLMIHSLKWNATLAAEGLSEKAANGKLNTFDLDLLLKNIALLEGGATQRVEVLHGMLNPNTSATIRLLEASKVTVTTPAVDEQAQPVALPLPESSEAVGMGSEPKKTPALSAPTPDPAPPAPGPVV